MVAAIGGIGSALGGVLGGIGAKQAAQEQATIEKQALQTQRNVYNTSAAEFAPYQAAGQDALTQQLDLLGLGGSTRATGADTAAQIQYLAGSAIGKSGKKIQKYLQANPNVPPDQQLAAIRQIADPYEVSALDAYTAANPYQPATSSSPGAAQQSSIDALKASPAFTSLYNTGNDTILQDAAATGGLRGGNAQNSLANFGSSLLASVIQQQLSNLGGLTGQGLTATSSLASDAQNNANAQNADQSKIGSANAVATASPYAALQGIISQLTGGGLAGLGNFFGGGAGSGVGSAGYNPANAYSNITAGYGPTG